MNPSNSTNSKEAAAFKRALSNYMPVLKIIHDISDKTEDHINETFPANWQDPLELYGSYVVALKLSEAGMKEERAGILSLLRDRSPKWVWENRCRLVAETIYVRDCF